MGYIKGSMLPWAIGGLIYGMLSRWFDIWSWQYWLLAIPIAVVMMLFDDWHYEYHKRWEEKYKND